MELAALREEAPDRIGFRYRRRCFYSPRLLSARFSPQTWGCFYAVDAARDTYLFAAAASLRTGHHTIFFCAISQRVLWLYGSFRVGMTNKNKENVGEIGENASEISFETKHALASINRT